MSGLAAPAGVPAGATKPPDRGTRWAGAVAFAVLVGIALLTLYLIHPIASGFRFPVGPDGPVYTWLARSAEATGLPDGPGAGPGVPGLTLFLGGLAGAEPLAVVTVLGPVLAVACGLAAAGLIESALGRDRDRAALAAVLTGAFAAYLAGGWLANLALVAVYLGALAALAVVGRSWRTVVLAGGLLAAGGLSHRVFLALGVAILIPVVLVRLPEAVAKRRSGARWADTDAVRMAAALAGGVAGAGAGLAWLATEPRIPGDTSQDGFFRRLGLRDLLADRYRERLWGDLTRAAVPVTLGLGLAVAGGPGGNRGAGRRFLTTVWLSWAAITAVGVALLAVTSWGPPNRVLQFAFFIPIGAAVGGAALARRRWAGGAMVVLAGSLFAAVSMGGWFRQSPAFDAADLAAARTAGRAVASLSAGTPLAFLVDTDQPAAAYHVTRAGNVLRMGVPPDRIADVRLLVGQPEDIVAGRPTLTGDPEHDRISRTYLREAETGLDRGALIVVRRFNPLIGLRRGDPSDPLAVTVTRGSMTSGLPAGRPADGVGPMALAAGSVGALAALALLGGGWARWGLPGAGRRAAAATAPSAGIGVAVVATFLTDRFGLGLDGPAAVVPALLLGAAGYAAAWSRRGQGRLGDGRRTEAGGVLEEQRR
jgi:hypothetical protein